MELVNAPLNGEMSLSVQIQSLGVLDSLFTVVEEWKRCIRLYHCFCNCWGTNGNQLWSQVNVLGFKKNQDAEQKMLQNPAGLSVCWNKPLYHLRGCWFCLLIYFDGLKNYFLPLPSGRKASSHDIQLENKSLAIKGCILLPSRKALLGK